MSVISDRMDMQVIRALASSNEYQVAKQFNLRVAAVRAIRAKYSPAEPDSQLGLDLKPVKATPMPETIRNMDFSSVENRVLASFFTPDGKATPAFWGYVQNYVKRSQHALLDILNQHEIYNPEHLTYALNFSKRIDEYIQTLPIEQRMLMVQQLSKGIYEDHINQTNPQSSVPDSE